MDERRRAMGARGAWLIVVLLAGVADAGGTHPITRCEQGGVVSYQDVPCVQGAMTGTWRPPPGQAVRRAPARRAGTGARGRARARESGVGTARKRVRAPAMVMIPLLEDPVGCARARREQARLRARQPHADLLQQRRWEDARREACR